MLLYVDPAGNYPRFVGDIWVDNPNWVIGEPLPSGWTLVAETEPPLIPSGQILEEEFPEEVNGVLTQKWILRNKNQQEIDLDLAAQTARQKLVDLGLTEAEVDALARGLR